MVMVVVTVWLVIMFTFLVSLFVVMLVLAIDHIVRYEPMHDARNDLDASNATNKTADQNPSCCFRIIAAFH